MLPEYYRDPKKYKLYIVETDQGLKRTYAKSIKHAQQKALTKNLQIISIKQWRAE